jgi:DNA-binding response OmpR family regulator
MGTRLALHASKVMRPEPCKHLPLDTSVILLPRKLESAPAGPRYILTVRRAGYRPAEGC